MFVTVMVANLTAGATVHRSSKTGNGQISGQQMHSIHERLSPIHFDCSLSAIAISQHWYAPANQTKVWVTVLTVS